MSKKKKRAVIGWREWVSLPDLGVETIKAKVDTGARSSALHAFNLQSFVRDNKDWVRFEVHPVQRTREHTLETEARVLERRVIRNSGGHEEERIVIRTHLRIEGQEWPIDLTLTRRDAMGFRMLLGREAVRGRFVVDPGTSYIFGRPDRSPDDEQDPEDTADQLAEEEQEEIS